MIGIIKTAAALLLFTSPALSQPVDLAVCGDRPPDCGLYGPLLVDGCKGFRTYSGRVSWFPLKNIGPIRIELQTRWFVGLNGPLYVQIFALPESLPPDFCRKGALPGFVIGSVRGAQVCGGDWETIGPINIDHLVPRGASYALQLEGFRIFEREDFHPTPGVDCIRLTSVPSPIEAISWARVKRMYR